jgi:type IV secretory pathway TrbL component
VAAPVAPPAPVNADVVATPPRDTRKGIGENIATGTKAAGTAIAGAAKSTGRVIGDAGKTVGNGAKTAWETVRDGAIDVVHVDRVNREILVSVSIETPDPAQGRQTKARASRSASSTFR